MTARGKKGTTKQKATHSLATVRKLLLDAKYALRPNVLTTADDDFGWKAADIVKALGKLQSKHFYKTTAHTFKPPAMMDYYKAGNLCGEDVYTHFYIDPDTDELVISSFKEL